MRTEDGYFISQCLNGDSSAFSFLVDRYKASVFAIAYAKLDNFHDAEDATQEVFTKAYSKLRTLKRWDSFRIWLYTMTLNHCRMQLRSRSTRPDREFIEDQKAINEPSVGVDDNFQMDESLNKALSKLPEIYRQVIILHYLGEMSTDEVAQYIGVSPDAVRKRLSRARIELKEGILAMMSRTFEENKLQAGFTFRMVELVKHIKINANPMSRITGLSWGISSTTWLLIAILGFALNLSISKPVIDLSPAIPGDIPTLSPIEFFVPVDVLTATSIKKNDTRDNKKSFALMPLAESDKWVEKAAIMTVRDSLSTSVVNGMIYAIGGWLPGDISTNVVEEYDPIKDKCTKKANMPTARWSLATSVVDYMIYAIGGASGVNGTSTVEIYNPATDKWTKGTNMPTARWGLSACAVNGKIYAIGGGSGFGPCFSTVEEYDPVKDTWTKKADMPTARDSLSVSVVNGKIYAIGGRSEIVIAQWNSLSAVEEYDPVTDTWTKKAKMPTARCYLSTSVVNGKIFAIGGSSVFGTAFPTVEVYDPATDKWDRKADMLTGRMGLSTSEINGKIYAFEGTTVGGIALATVEEYIPEGWPFNAIFPQNNLPSTWGEQKQER